MLLHILRVGRLVVKYHYNDSRAPEVTPAFFISLKIVLYDSVGSSGSNTRATMASVEVEASVGIVEKQTTATHIMVASLRTPSDGEAGRRVCDFFGRSRSSTHHPRFITSNALLSLSFKKHHNRDTLSQEYRLALY